MLCPQCRTEYRQGFSICADCGADLVSGLPPQPPKPPKEPEPSSSMATVFESYDLTLMAVAKSILEDANIRYFVKNELAESYFVIGPMEIQVEPSDFETARELLASLDDGGLIRADEDLED